MEVEKIMEFENVNPWSFWMGSGVEDEMWRQRRKNKERIWLKLNLSVGDLEGTKLLLVDMKENGRTWSIIAVTLT